MKQIKEMLGEGEKLKKEGEDDASAFLRIMFSKADDDSSKLVLNPFMEAYQLTGRAKVEGAMEFLKVLIENQ